MRRKAWLLQRTFKVDDVDSVVSIGVFRSREKAVQYVDKVDKVTDKIEFEDKVLFRTATQIFHATEIDYFDIKLPEIRMRW